MSMKHPLHHGACLAVVLLASCASEPPLTAERLTRTFAQVAFGDEYDPGRRIDRIRKWTEPLRISLHGKEAPRYRPTVRRHARELAGLTGLEITIQPPLGRNANVAIHFVRRDKMAALARPHAPRPDLLPAIIPASACLFVFRRNADWRIVSALILVSIDEPVEHNRRCLLEELTQVLGLPNDSNLIRRSVFHDAGGYDSLPPADRIMLRALYDPRMKPGTPKQQAVALFRRILTERGVP